MGMMGSITWWIFFGDIFIGFSRGETTKMSDYSTETNIQNEERGKLHRLQLLFPLLLRISTRLATLVPTAFMALIGIFLFVLFSKKAFLVSLFALFLSVSDKMKKNQEDIVIHKINSYPDYNNEEHYYYYHPYSPYKNRHYKRHKFKKKWVRRTDYLL